MRQYWEAARVRHLQQSRILQHAGLAAASQKRAGRQNGHRTWREFLQSLWKVCNRSDCLHREVLPDPKDLLLLLRNACSSHLQNRQWVCGSNGSPVNRQAERVWELTVAIRCDDAGRHQREEQQIAGLTCSTQGDGPHTACVAHHRAG